MSNFRLASELNKNQEANVRSALHISQNASIHAGFPVTDAVVNMNSINMKSAAQLSAHMKPKLPHSMQVPNGWQREKEVTFPATGENPENGPDVQFVQFITPVNTAGHSDIRVEILKGPRKGERLNCPVTVIDMPVYDDYKESKLLAYKKSHEDASLRELDRISRYEGPIDDAFLMDSVRNLQTTSTQDELSNLIKKNSLSDDDITNALSNLTMSHNSYSLDVQNELSRLSKKKDLSDSDIAQALSNIRISKNSQDSNIDQHLINDLHNGTYSQAILLYLGNILEKSHQITCFPELLWCMRHMDGEGNARQVVVIERVEMTLLEEWKFRKTNGTLSAKSVMADFAQIVWNLFKLQQLIGFCHNKLTVDNIRAPYAEADKYLKVRWDDTNLSIPTSGNLWKFVNLQHATFVHGGFRFVPKMDTTVDLPHTRDLQSLATSCIHWLSENLSESDTFKVKVIDMLREWIKCTHEQDITKLTILEAGLQPLQNGVVRPVAVYAMSNMKELSCANSIAHLQLHHFEFMKA